MFRPLINFAGALIKNFEMFTYCFIFRLGYVTFLATRSSFQKAVLLRDVFMLDPKFVRRGLFLVFMILFLDVIGIAIIMPVLPAYLEELTGGTVSDAALDGGWLLVVYAAMQFLFAPFLGNLSDRFGRRPILLLSVLTFAIDNLICAIATSLLDALRRQGARRLQRRQLCHLLGLYRRHQQ